MDALSVQPVGPATLSALSALRAVQVLPPSPVPGGTPEASPRAAEGLAQTLLLDALSTAVRAPLAEAPSPNLGLAQETTASLLAALTPPSAPAAATTDVPVQPPAPRAAADVTTAAAPALPAAVPADLPVAQDTFATGSSLEFALQTALRFGAGVAAQAAPTAPALGPAADLIRDATAVLRTGNLQPHAGGPGPEAFTQPQGLARNAGARALRTYQTPPLAEAGQLDVMA